MPNPAIPPAIIFVSIVLFSGSSSFTPNVFVGFCSGFFGSSTITGVVIGFSSTGSSSTGSSSVGVGI